MFYQIPSPEERSKIATIGPILAINYCFTPSGLWITNEEREKFNVKFFDITPFGPILGLFTRPGVIGYDAYYKVKQL